MTNPARIAVLAFALATPASLTQASDTSGRGAIPAFEVNTIIASMGFVPTGAPVRRGPVYVVRAIDDDDIPVRVTVDARSGRVLTVTELALNDPYNSPAHVGSYPAPPGTVPAVTYRAPPTVSPPAVRQSAVTPPRTPTPRPRPASKPAETTASIPDASATPGKSIPAPVAPSAAKSSGAAAPESADGSAKTETPPVPVAPLE